MLEHLKRGRESALTKYALLYGHFDYYIPLFLIAQQCRAAVAQLEAETNIKLAEESKILADATKAESHSVANLQYLAMFLLPLSLSSVQEHHLNLSL